MSARVHHVAIRVHEMATARRFFEDVFGLGFGGEVEQDALGVRTVLSPEGVELVAPLDSDSPLAGTLAKHGEGLNLLSFEVDDLDAVADRLERRGGRFASRVTVPGGEVAFVSPRQAFGVLLQVYQRIDGPQPS